MPTTKSENPWNINSLYEFQYFNCPSCEFKHGIKQDFVYHAYQHHPESIDYLTNISDGSLKDVLSPWNTIEKTKHKPKVKGNTENFKTESDEDNFSKNYDENEDNSQINLEDPLQVSKSDATSCGKFIHYSSICDLEKQNNAGINIEPIKDEVIDSPLISTIGEEFNDDDIIASNQMVMCYYCNITFEYSEIRKHIGTQHPTEEVIYTPIDSVKIVHEEWENRVIHEYQSDLNCDICSKSFKRLDNLKRHKKIHEGKLYDCSACPKSFSTSLGLEVHVAGVHKERKSHKCIFCEKVFLKKHMLSTHFKTFHENQNHNCEKCGKNFSSMPLLRNHIKNVHGDKIHTCESCGKSFAKPYILKAHVARAHEVSEIELICNVCDKTFNNSVKLQKHISDNHNGNAKEHICDVCGKSFSKANKMKIHNETVHEGRRDHKCNICNKFFSQSISMKKHIREIHEGIKSKYNCDRCEKIFYDRRYLRDHIASVHEGQKEHLCKICGKTFSYTLSLKEHTNAVHGDKTFNCTHCGKTFAALAYMKAHTEHVHEGKPWRPRNRENKTRNT